MDKLPKLIRTPESRALIVYPDPIFAVVRHRLEIAEKAVTFVSAKSLLALTRALPLTLTRPSDLPRQHQQSNPQHSVLQQGEGTCCLILTLA